MASRGHILKRVGVCGMERLEPRHLLAAQPILSEFVASNDSTLSDGFGEDSDWIEIRNAGDAPLDLLGYHLTDKTDNTTKWAFTQSTFVEPGGYLVVFASDNDTIDPLGYWHTNFKLSASGEYLALADPNGVVVSEFNAGGVEYPPQLTDLSYGLGGAQSETLFETGSPIDYLLPTNGSLGATWTDVGFDAPAAGFVTAAGGIGYEDNPGATINYNNEIDTQIPSGTTSVYLRHDFDLSSAASVSELELTLTYDDGFALYLNGTFLFSENAPASLDHSSAAVGGRPDAEVLSPTTYSLDTYRSLLVNGDNVLAIHALNNANSSDMLLSASLTARVEAFDSGQVGYLDNPTPGAPNASRIDLGPVITDIEFAPDAPGPGTPLVITAKLEQSIHPTNSSSVRLHYRRMFEAEVISVMVDNGLGADAVAGDGVYTAVITAPSEGEMIRWYVTAEDTEGTLSRAPRFADPLDSAEYFGTVVADPNASDDLPVMYWFVEDEAAAATREGTRASLYYLDEFYDNIQVDLHGQSTATAPFLKKSYDFDANQGQKFKIAEGLGRHSDFNLLTNYADQTKVRHPIAYGAFAEAGSAHHLAFPVSVHRNGEFYALYDFVEQGDSEYLERLGYDPDGALYKVNNNLEDPNSTVINVEKKTRLDEDRSDLQEVVDADDLTGSSAAQWDYDNFDTASLVNYLAVQAVIANGDFGHKNQYLYRDSNETLLWQFLPWDTDLSFGHRWRAEVSPPYFDDVLHTNTSVFFGFNDIVQRQYQDSNFREMYFRRIRTLSDHFYGATNQPVSTGWVHQQFDQQRILIADEAIADTAEWGIHPNFSRTPDQAVDQILNEFVPLRRDYLAGLSYIPDSQAASVDVSFNTLPYQAGDGPESEEFFVLHNDETTAVDISGWSVSGSLSHVFKAGTVLPAGGSLYVVSDVQGFLNRKTGPRGGQTLIIQGNYKGELSASGGVLTLADSNQVTVDQLSYSGVSLPGDYNGDGVVNAADYTVWRDTLNSTTVLVADGNGDQIVNQADRTLWAQNYSASGTNDPPPAAALAFAGATPPAYPPFAVSLAESSDREAFLEADALPPFSPAMHREIDRLAILLASREAREVERAEQLSLRSADKSEGQRDPSTPEEASQPSLDIL